MNAKHQRLVLVLLALVAVLGASGLALSALKDQAEFFYAPGDVKRDGLPLGKHVRLGGMVAKGSIARQADGVSIAIVVSDGVTTVPVRVRGVVPNLFTADPGVVAEGQFQPDGRFVADTLHPKTVRAP